MSSLIITVSLIAATLVSYAGSDVIKKQYRRYKLQSNGCQNSTEMTHLICTVGCSRTTDCVAFSYDKVSQTCSKCFQGNVTSFSFDKEMYWLRNAWKYNIDAVPVSVVGDFQILMKMQVTLLLADSNKTLFAELIGTQNNVTVVPIRLDFFLNASIAVISKTISGWNSRDVCCSSPVNISGGTELDVAVLRTNLHFVAYVNRVYCCSYVHRVPLSVASNFHVFNFMHLIELSY